MVPEQFRDGTEAHPSHHETRRVVVTEVVPREIIDRSFFERRVKDILHVKHRLA